MTPAFTVWRFSAYDTPVRMLPSRRPGRFNGPGDPPTQYFSLHPWGPWAELLRWEDRRTSADALQVATRLWVARCALAGPVVRLDFQEAASRGVDPSALVGDDHAVCQGLAREERARGTSALVVPSAALPGTDNLVVLGPGAVVPWQVPPVDEVDVPAAVSADRAGPPLALLPLVRYRGQPHAGLDAFSAGSTFRLPEPVPTPLA